MRIQRHTRTAFTLVEMMVAVALTLFLMAIIAQAFGSAQKTFTAMRTAGQLQERMRQGSQVIRKDLSAEHFDGPFLPGRTGPRVGDQRLDLPGWVPPRGGYFEIRQFPVPGFPYGFPASVPEPIQFFLANTFAMTDAEGIVSTRAVGATTANPQAGHVLRFTTRLPELPAAELFSAELPPTVTVVGAPVPAPLANNPQINSFPTGQGIVYTRWAEVQYWLREIPGEFTPQTANGPALQRYSLRRRVRLLAANGVTYPNVPAQEAALLMARYPDVAMARLGPGQVPDTVVLRVLGPEDVSNPGITPLGDPIRMPYWEPVQRLNLATGQRPETGDDILMTDVLSFEVKAAWFANQMTPSFEAIRPGSSPPSPTMVDGNTEVPFSDLPLQPRGPAFNEPVPLNTTYAGQRVFDTWYLHPTQSDFIDWEKHQPTTQSSQVGFLTPNQFQPPVRINVRAVQIKIRVWDAEKEQARQATIVQEI